MKQQLKNYRDEFTDRVLTILWDQWTTLGVKGYGKNWMGSTLDPEALLLFSSTIARYDARLFDSILEWIGINGRFINLTRLNRMVKHEKFEGHSVLKAMVSSASTSENKSKWSRLSSGTIKEAAEPIPLFFRADGTPLPVINKPDSVFLKYGFLRDIPHKRDTVHPFHAQAPGNLLLRLRAFFGVNARCEILLYLLLNGRGSPRAISRDSYYFPATSSKALAEMEQSDLLISQIEGRHRYYQITSPLLKKIFIDEKTTPTWIVWARLLRSIELIWLFLHNELTLTRTTLEQSSALRRVLKNDVIPRFNNCGIPFLFGRESNYSAEKLIPFFIKRFNETLDWLSNE
ncbi:winged helix-turn-helix domain-containing protein [candidate division CSSED10-310 bacterium]|uniref:Winged helix-turn-helix domain-containing protein n=1 Tax=candidate division CSSED10-310 bacterium TaxID=2855610 RepID=A0ABV6YV96_UNCC1